MSAKEKSIKKLGILAGGGTLPRALMKACIDNDIQPFVVGFEGQTDTALKDQTPHVFWTHMGAAGKIIKILQTHGITDIVFIGSIRRPSLKELRPDLTTIQFFTETSLKAFGDDGMLSHLRIFLEKRGFTIHGVHKFLPDLLAPDGVLTNAKPNKEHMNDIRRGFDVSQAMGKLDIGQAVIVQQGYILGVEAAEGTNELIKRCAPYIRKGSGAILVKTCKPDQDRDLDMPTIGPQTISQAAKYGLSGIAIQAGATLVTDPSGVAEIANSHTLFVIGIDPHNSENT